MKRNHTTRRNILRRLAALAIAAGLCVTPALAHEVDQFSVPPGREMADIGDELGAWAYDALDRAVIKLNNEVRALGDKPDPAELARIRSPEHVAHAVFDEFPIAYQLIENMETEYHSDAAHQRHPGLITAHKQFYGSDYYFIPADPRVAFRLWHASVTNVYGAYVGTDKIGHFSDMGRLYFDVYREALRSGKTEKQAHDAILYIATEHPIYSESGLLGLASSGDYSNGDLASNYAGFLFYRNLTEHIALKGQPRPPMLERNGNLWKLAPHVRRDSDFFAWFYSEHFDEALNPGMYESMMRPAVRRDIQNHAEALLWRYRDANGSFRPPQYFVSLWHLYSTYYGEDYGHRGTADQLVSLDSAIYDDPPDAKLESRNRLGMTALHLAALRGDAGRVSQLILQGADVRAVVKPPRIHTPDTGATPLHLAAAAGDTRSIELFIRRGADINAASAAGATPLHRAALDAAATQILLLRGANAKACDTLGRSVLHWAAADPDGVTIAALIKAGADPAARDNQNRTPLHRAVELGNLGAIAALLKAKADPNVRDALGITPLHLAAAQRDTAALLALLDAGADPRIADALGYTALHDAARRGYAPAIAILLKRGANPAAPDAYGSTPQQLATRHQHTDAAALLNTGAKR